MIVKAKQGTVCPRLDARMPPINDSEPQAVPDIAYYRRRIADGSLERVTEAVGQPTLPDNVGAAPRGRPDADDKPKAKKEKA